MYVPLRTANLTLRPLIPADAPALARYRSDPRVTRYQGWTPASPADALADMANLATEPDQAGTWFQLGIVLGQDGPLIGDLGLHFPANRPRQAEVGITLAPEHQGRGYATEALRVALDYLFGVLGKHRVYASVDPRNGRSVALLERVGMRQEGHTLESLWFRGEWTDDLIYALLRREWEALRVGGAMRAAPRMEKVTCFVIRETDTGRELLLLEHPHAGIQLPAGTVTLGETPERAALREAHEETGLGDLEIVQALGCEEAPVPEGYLAVIDDAPVYARPDVGSFCWARLRRGIWVRSLRSAPGWEHISYEEPDHLLDPAYMTYQITGWVPARALARMQARWFYELRCREDTPSEWTTRTDNHLFRLFWASLEALPQLMPPQDRWLRWLNQAPHQTDRAD